jgi:hypothetical protein
MLSYRVFSNYDEVGTPKGITRICGNDRDMSRLGKGCVDLNSTVAAVFELSRFCVHLIPASATTCMILHHSNSLHYLGGSYVHHHKI